MRGLQVWSEGRKRRVGAGLKVCRGLPGVESTERRGGGGGHDERGGGWFDGAINVNESTLQDFGSEISLGGVLQPLALHMMVQPMESGRLKRVYCVTSLL